MIRAPRAKAFRGYGSRRSAAGLTLLELVVVLTILAALGTVMITQTTSLTNEARYEQTVRTLEQLEAAVVGDSDLRGPDGQRLITGFVADVGRLPVSLDELWLIGSLNEFAIDKSPTGDTSLAVAGGWRGPYLRLPVGANDLTDGWGRPFGTFDEDGETIASGPIKIVGSLGPTASIGGTNFERDLPLVFEATANAVDGSTGTADIDGISSAVPARFEGPVSVSGVEGPGGADAGDDTNSGLANYVVIRVYGPNPSTGGVQTLAQYVQDVSTTPSVGVTTLPALAALGGGDLTVGPRIIRAYQVPNDPTTTPEQNLDPSVASPPNPAYRLSDPFYFVNIPGGLPQPLPTLVLEVP